MKQPQAKFNDRVMTRDNAWTAVSILAVVAGATMGRTLLKSGWRAVTGNEPPKDPDADDTTWKQALTWCVLTGAIIGVVRVVSRKGASAFERRWG